LTYDVASGGRVLVIYGSSQGLQVNRSSGKITFDPNLDEDKDPSTPAAPLDPAEVAAIDVVAVNHCETGVNPACKMQLLTSPLGAGERFGFAVTGVSSIEGSSSDAHDELVVTDPDEDWGGDPHAGTAYFYKGG